jgi:hypothetical protein
MKKKIVFCSLYCAGCFSSLNLSFFVYHRQAWPGLGSLLLLAWFSSAGLSPVSATLLAFSHS